jgi:hypothetical protein
MRAGEEADPRNIDVLYGQGQKYCLIAFVDV